MRVYVPLTLSGLAEAYKAGEVASGAEPLAAYGVTPALREWCATDDIEELEYAALGQAAQASLRLIARDAGAARRRVVLAVDVADGLVEDGRDAPGAGAGAELGAVRVSVAGGLGLKKAAAVHVDAAEADADVAAAAAAEDPDEAEGLEDHELLWFATQEISGLIA
ncbi:DUF6912 family protein [Streptomyces sp. NPDC055060]